MVIRGGENIYPREIEEFLYRHPKVQDVQVVGVPDAKYGEELCAWIIAKPGQRWTRTRCAPSARARSRTTRCRATSASSTLSDDGDGQDPEVQDPRGNGARAGISEQKRLEPA
jgi:acyl-CoA synthetase (AMP-forming)/AMP-acid ligase II